MGARSILGLLLIGLIGGAVWTQRQAHRYGYDAALGAPVWDTKLIRTRLRLYAPWRGVQWWWQWQVPPSQHRLVIGGGLVGLGMSTAAGIAYQRHRRHAPPAMEGHGTARWATRTDIKKAGLW